MIDTITILGGQNRAGVPEAVERIDLKMGEVVSIVGPTGSGKTTSSTTWNSSRTPTPKQGGAS